MVKWLAERADGCANDTCRNAWRLIVYIWLNIWTLLPGTCAVAVLILVRQSTYLAESCPSPSAIRVVTDLPVNPLFCPTATLIASILQAPLQDVRQALQPPFLLESERSKARQSSDLAEQSAARREMAAAAVKLANVAAAARPPPGAAPPAVSHPLLANPHSMLGNGPQPAVSPPPQPPLAPSQGAPAQTPQQLVLQRKAEEAQAAFDSAKTDLGKAADTAAARRQTRGQATIFREAKARLRWIASYAAVVVFAIGSIFAGIWVAVASIDDHLFPEETALGEQQRHRVGLGLCLLVAASGLFFRKAWFAIYAASRANLFASLPPESPIDVRLLRFQDAMTTFIFGDGRTATGQFLPAAQPMLEQANRLIVFAILALACAISSTLYQRPFQILPLGNPRDPAEVAVAQKDDRDPKPTPQKPYDRLLVRCFQRLNICIYIGATLLVICVISISARYSWIAALLDPAETDEPWKSALPNAVNGLAEELALQYGLGFTTLLLGLLIPTWVILRRRAWVVARLRNPGRDDVKTLQDFLSSNGMAFTSVQKYAQVFAVLAPAGAGVFVTALKALTGASS